MMNNTSHTSSLFQSSQRTQRQDSMKQAARFERDVDGWWWANQHLGRTTSGSWNCQGGSFGGPGASGCRLCEFPKADREKCSGVAEVTPKHPCRPMSKVRFFRGRAQNDE